ncbi:MAG: DinB family protein [Chloroflexota bacterium]|nr:DinB family protein [Chloroflexota bacterium]
MRATVDRGDALRLLRIEHQAVAALIDELSGEEMTRRDTIQHGMYYDQECSFKDLLAHLICYEVYALEAIGEWGAGRMHWAIEAVKDPRRGREIHYGGIAERADSSLAAQLDEYRRVSAGLEAAIAELSDADWRRAPSFALAEAADLGGMIEGIMVLPPRPMYRHLPVHIPDAKQYIHSLR